MMNSTIDYSTSDRFIPLRRSVSDPFRISNTYQYPLKVSCKEYCENFRINGSGLNSLQEIYKKSHYKNALINKIFTNTRRVLYFSPKQKAIKHNINKNTNDEENWPVRARSKPLITSPDMVLDMPEFGSTMIGNNQKVDWGAKGYIACLRRNSIHNHNPDTDLRVRINMRRPLGDCIKWNIDGNCLAFALKDKAIGVWDMQAEKILGESSLGPLPDKISCMAYTSRLLITGHTNGVLQIWSHKLELTRSVTGAHNMESLITVKVSCNERYLATSGMDGYVRIWSLPSCAELYQIICQPSPILALDWHPWKEPILVIGRSNLNSFCLLWNVNQPTDISTNKHPNEPNVDCLSFNPISAELVISFWLNRPEESQYTQNIVVQSSLSRIVDDLNFHTTRTPYLLWDKNGTRLATLGADENLAIWDFFGMDYKKKYSKNLFKTTDGILKGGTIR